MKNFDGMLYGFVVLRTISMGFFFGSFLFNIMSFDLASLKSNFKVDEKLATRFHLRLF